MNKLFIVIKHEFKTVVTNKGFIIFTILGPFLLIAVSFFPAFIQKKTEKTSFTIGYISNNENIIHKIKLPLVTMGIELVELGTKLSLADSSVLKGDIYGYIVIPDNFLQTDSFEIITKDIADYKIIGILQSVLGQTIINERLKLEGISELKIVELTKCPVIFSTMLTKEGEKVKKDFLSVFLSSIAFTMLLYMTVLIYGQSIGRSILLEKKSKTVEILLSSIKPITLMLGKIFGLIGASLLQYTIWLSSAIVVTKLLKTSSIPIPEIPAYLYFYLIIYFILAFLLYATIYSALGALSQDETHLQQLGWPIIMFLIIPMLSLSSIITNPYSTFAIVLSFFPLTSAIIMFTRISVSYPPLWEILLSIIIQIISIAGLFILSAKIFKTGILTTGKKFSFKEILTWLKI